MENPFNTQENKPKRSTLLTVFLVLTFIGSGFSFLFFTPISMAYVQVVEFLEYLAEDDATVEVVISMMANLGGATGFVLYAILYLFSLVGAFLMWRLNKRGFHLYAGAQIVILLVPTMLGATTFPSIFSTLITALFVFVYARELKIFAKQQPVEE